MILRSRNIALEGFAHDFYTPETVALVGFAESPAQTDDVIVRVAGGSAQIYIRRRRSVDPVAPVILPSVLASLHGESPAQTDNVECEIAAIQSRASKKKHKAEAKVRASIVVLSTVASAVSGSSPSQSDVAVVAVRVSAGSESGSPSQTDEVDAIAYRIDHRGSLRLRGRRMRSVTWYRDRP